MLINLFAVFVNYFALSPRYEDEYNEYYLFTDNGYHISKFGGSTTGGNAGYYYSTTEFWPFVDFKVWNSWDKIERFKGIFDGFDHIEFIAYTFLIFGVIFIRKLW